MDTSGRKDLGPETVDFLKSDIFVGPELIGSPDFAETPMFGA